MVTKTFIAGRGAHGFELDMDTYAWILIRCAEPESRHEPTDKRSK